MSIVYFLRTCSSNWQGGGLLLCDLYSLSAYGDPGAAAAQRQKPEASASGFCFRDRDLRGDLSLLAQGCKALRRERTLIFP